MLSHKEGPASGSERGVQFRPLGDQIGGGLVSIYASDHAEVLGRHGALRRFEAAEARPVGGTSVQPLP